MNTRHAEKFTLIEMMIVIAVIAILLSLLLPGLAKAKEHARRSVCANSLRQCVIAVTNYAADFDGMMPTSPYGSVSGCPMDYISKNWRNPAETPTDSTGWYKFVDTLTMWDPAGRGATTTYLPLHIAKGCPSSDIPQTGGSQWNYAHYNYRNNSFINELNYKLERINSGGGVFSDATYLRYNVWGAFYTTSTASGVKWSHRNGGNIASYSGAVKWVNNQRGLDDWNSWPGKWTKNFTYLDTLLAR